MEMQKNVDKSKLVLKRFKIGDKVTWSSQGSSTAKKKVGRIVAVMNPNTNYAGLSALPKRLFEDILRENGMTRDGARAIINDEFKYSHFYIRTLSKKYALMFEPYEGMYRDETHYLVEVDRGEGKKPALYHPLTKYLRKV